MSKSMKKYEVIFNNNGKDEIMLKTDDFQEAVNLTKSIAKNFHMKVYNPKMSSVLMCYVNKENSRIVKAIGLIEN